MADLVQRVKDGVVQGKVDNREFAGRKRLPNLTSERVPRALAPEIIGPEKASSKKVVAQPGRLVLVEVGAARLGHHDERTAEKLVIGEADDRVIELPVCGLAYQRRRQLGEAEGEIYVRSWVVDEPAAAVAVRRVPEHDPAECESPIVARVPGEPGSPHESAAAPSLRRGGAAHGDDHGAGDEQGGASHTAPVQGSWRSRAWHLHSLLPRRSDASEPLSQLPQHRRPSEMVNKSRSTQRPRRRNY